MDLICIASLPYVAVAHNIMNQTQYLNETAIEIMNVYIEYGEHVVFTKDYDLSYNSYYGFVLVMVEKLICVGDLSYQLETRKLRFQYQGLSGSMMLLTGIMCIVFVLFSLQKYCNFHPDNYLPLQGVHPLWVGLHSYTSHLCHVCFTRLIHFHSYIACHLHKN